MKFTVREVVCDYGVFEDGDLKLIVNSRSTALKIVDLLYRDHFKHCALNNIKVNEEDLFYQLFVSINLELNDLYYETHK